MGNRYPPEHHLSAESCRARGFKKGGPPGNPKGIKTIITKDVKDYAKALTMDAIESLAGIMKNDKANASARVQAAVALLDRGWGRPKQSVEVEVNHDASGLAAALTALQDRMQIADQRPVIEANVIDADPVEVTVSEAKPPKP